MGGAQVCVCGGGVRWGGVVGFEPVQQLLQLVRRGGGGVFDLLLSREGVGGGRREGVSDRSCRSCFFWGGER